MTCCSYVKAPCCTSFLSSDDVAGAAKEMKNRNVITAKKHFFATAIAFDPPCSIENLVFHKEVNAIQNDGLPLRHTLKK